MEIIVKERLFMAIIAMMLLATPEAEAGHFFASVPKNIPRIGRRGGTLQGWMGDIQPRIGRSSSTVWKTSTSDPDSSTNQDKELKPKIAKLITALNCLDLNGDGEITSEELISLFKAYLFLRNSAVNGEEITIEEENGVGHDLWDNKNKYSILNS